MLGSLWLFASLMAHGANVTSAQFSGGDRLEVLLDRPVKETEVRTEFLRDIIQITLSGTSVYPARILPAVQSERLVKVFLYQYAPKQVRIRITTKGASEQYKDAFVLKQQGRRLFASLSPEHKDEIPVTAARTTVSDPELLSKITSESPAKVTKKPETVPAPVANPVALPGLGKVVGGLAIAILGLLALLVSIRRLQRVAEKSQKKMQGFFKRIGLAKHAPMIEVVSTQALGPKKSISVVKVQGRMLVLGISNDSISLITDLGDREGAEGDGESDGDAPTRPHEFQSVLDENTKKVAAPDAHARIRARLEGLVRL